MSSQDVYQVLVKEMDAVYRLARHLVPRQSDAEDLVQETFCRAFKSVDRFRLAEFGPRPWLFRILHNLIATHYTSKSRDARHVAYLQHEPERLPTNISKASFGEATPQLDWEEIDERLKRALDSLSIPARMTFLLHAVEGLKYREIAQVIEVPIGTVMSRLSRARLELATHLREFAREERWDTRRELRGVIDLRSQKESEGLDPANELTRAESSDRNETSDG